MRLGHSTLLLGVVFSFCEAGLLPVRQVACSPVTVFNAVTVTTTITDTPPTVTILQEDPHSVASSMASVDTQQVVQQSQQGPVSNKPATTTPVFTHSVKVSGYEVTELPNDGTSVFYVSKDPTTTNGGFKPSRTIVAEITTVTVLPTHQVTSNRQDAQYNITTTNTTSHTVFSSPSGGWNGTATDTSSFVWGPGIGEPSESGTTTTEAETAVSYGSPNTLTALTGLTSGSFATRTVASITSTIYSVLTVTAPAAPTDGYEPDDSYDSPVSPAVVDELDKRQTCVWIYATIGGQQVGWCNNWDGRSTLTYTTWETTKTPGFIPGIGTVSVPSTTSEESISGSVTIQTSTDLPVTSSPTSSSTSPTACGEVGPFQIGFDNLPGFFPVDNNTAPFPPIFNPYDHFFWGAGWAYVPPPNEPFPPHSGDRLAQFVPTLNNTVIGSPNAGTIPPSSLGAGPRNYDSHYWFTARSVWVGCDNGATNLSQICDFVATAYQWNNATQQEMVVATQHFRIPPCPNFNKCQLTKITFNYLFYKLTTLSFYANVEGKVSQFWVDSLDMNWYDNTCDAGLARISSRKM